MKVTITLNDTDTNPHEKWGFVMNPFPKIARAEYSRLDYAIRKLEATPCPSLEKLKSILNELGGTQQFNDLCCERYKSGKRVKFDIEFPE